VKGDHAVAVVMVLLLALGGGCAVTKPPPSIKPPPPVVPVISEQERSFAGALVYLKAGKEQQARELLERVVTLPAISGITDEALFRLALLSIREETGKVATRAQSLLEQLENDFPASVWTSQAAPLAAYLAGVRIPRDRQKEIKTLRDHNLSLSRDIRELRQTIERLKSLDMELDQRIKR
jgi:hypothetical protein